MPEEKQFVANRPFNSDKQFGDFKMRTRLRYFDEKTIGEEMRDLYRIPESPKAVIDVGAHIGYTSLLCAQKGAVVYSFEPEKLNYETGVYNINLNGFQDKVHYINMGVGKSGRTKLYVHDTMSGTTSSYNVQPGLHEDEYQMVDFISIKDVFKNYNIEHCSLLKLDCEGSEDDIVNDLDDELVGKIDQISLEIHFKSSIKKLIDILSKWYVCEKIYRRMWVCRKKN